MESLDRISFSDASQLLNVKMFQRPVRFHSIPRFVVESAKLQPRSFPYNLPIGPRRPHQEMNRPPTLGLGSVRGLKETVDAEAPQQTDAIHPPIRQKMEKTSKPFTAQEIKSAEAVTVEEEILVPPIHEKNADLVRYRAVRREAKPEIWQEVACRWDKCQRRPNQFHQYESDRLFPAISTSAPRSTAEDEESEKARKGEKEATGMQIPKMQAPEGMQTRFTRPTPGYGGYVPRYPVEPRPPQGSWDEVYVNFSKLTYRTYPSYEYTTKEFAHKGPLSRLVTTTHPSNPFNKVNQWNSRPKKPWKRGNHSKLV